MTGLIRVEDFMEHLKSNGMVIVSEKLLGKADRFAKLKQLHNEYNTKQWFTYVDIEKAELFGPIKKKAIAVVVRKNLKENQDYIITDFGKHGRTKVHRTAVERIMSSRGITWL